MLAPARTPWLARAVLLRDRVVAARVDAASLAAFRILFGLLMAASTLRVIALGWIDEFYVLPTFHFTWDPFPWVQPLPGPLMHLHFAALVVLALAVALGFHYRASMLLFFLGFTYVELIDKTTYLNHYYLVSLLSGLLVVIPAHRIWSVDAWRRPGPRSLAGAPRTEALGRTKDQGPGTRDQTVPAWTVNLLRFQVAVVYLFAGLAKISADWLLDAQPLRIWLAARSDLSIIGSLFTQIWVAYAFSWFGAAYDLTIVFFLSWRRTRLLAYATVIVFHALTAVLFPIGMFPWIMIVATLLFFPPDWPRRWVGNRRTDQAANVPAGRRSNFATALLAVYAAIQIAVPLRAYWPGADSDWTCRGFNFAWRVMLVEKAGHAELIAADRLTGRRWPVRTRDYVTERQEKMMAQDPFMVRALARHVAADLHARGGGEVEVRADAFAALNGRPVQRLIDPRVDLAAAVPPDWIVPLQVTR